VEFAIPPYYPYQFVIGFITTPLLFYLIPSSSRSATLLGTGSPGESDHSVEFPSFVILWQFTRLLFLIIKGFVVPRKGILGKKKYRVVGIYHLFSSFYLSENHFFV